MIADDNYPNILTTDFFRLDPNESASTFFNDQFNVIIGNPPNLRIEEIGSVNSKVNFDLENALSKDDDLKIDTLSRRAGLFAFTIIHSSKFFFIQRKLQTNNQISEIELSLKA